MSTVSIEEKLKESVGQWVASCTKENRRQGNILLQKGTVFVTDPTTIDEMGKDLKSAKTLEKFQSKEGLQQLGLSLIV